MLAWLWIALANWLPFISMTVALRARLLRLAGMTIGPDPCILGPIEVRPRTTAKLISIGANCFINASVRFAGHGGVTLADAVMIGPNVSFETINHSLVHAPGRGRDNIAKPIVIEREAWIGAGAILLAGVTIGRGAVVAAGAVVTRDVPAMTLVGGVPARPLKDFSANTMANEPAGLAD
jgi:maltose O-acetyltransferase